MQNIITTASISESNSVKSGWRNRAKRMKKDENLFDDETIIVSSSDKNTTSTLIMSSSQASYKLSQFFGNPLDRLSTLLVKWNYIDECKALISQLWRNHDDSNNIAIEKKFEKLPYEFKDQIDYIRRWEPLIIEEIKAGVRNNIRNVNINGIGKVKVSLIESSVQSSLYTLDCIFEDINKSGDMEADFKRYGSNSQVSYMDLVLLSLHPITLPFNKDNLDHLSSSRALVGLVISSNSSRSDGSRGYQVKVDRELWDYLRLYQSSSTSTTSSSSKVVSISMNFVVLDSLISSWREFLALHDTLTASPLVDEILSSRASPLSIDTTIEDMNIPGVTATYMRLLTHNFNPSQLKSIKRATTNDGFTLIQGPPGTGKTTTVLGIINTIHLREYNRFYQVAIDKMLVEYESQLLVYAMKPISPEIHASIPWIQLIGKLACYKPHILVTAPSNTAIDTIIQRIFINGFYDGTASKYNPNILRIGSSNNVKVVSLEEIMEQETMSHCRSVNDIQIVMASIKRQLLNKLTILNQNFVFLRNLRLAFLNHELPCGWEVRINVETSLPYWVDHINKQSSNFPPPALGQSRPTTEKYKVHFYNDNTVKMNKKYKVQRESYDRMIIRNGDYTFETLPEYQIFSFRLTQALDQLDNLYKKLRRVEMCNSSPYMNQVTRQALESSIIDSTHIVFTTLNSAGHASLESTNFICTIIDEAVQATEPSVLIALRRGCQQCIMVGDPQQLPATVMSNTLTASKCGYSRSIFERLLHMRGHEDPLFIMLDTQYRMIPMISKMPSRMFYNNLLCDGPNVKEFDYIPPYLSLTSNDKLRPFILFDLEYSYETMNTRKLKSTSYDSTVSESNSISKSSVSQTSSSRTTIVGNVSKSNSDEADFIMILLTLIIAEVDKTSSEIPSIGIITPYSEQVTEIRNVLKSHAFIHSSTDILSSTTLSQRGKVDVNINTVDGYQGKEMDIVIISTVRSNDYGTIGFLSDYRRMNVAITRAKFGLYIIGNVFTLSTNNNWNQLIQYAEDLNVLWTISSPNTKLDIRDFNNIISSSLSISSTDCRIYNISQINSAAIVSSELEEGECSE